MQDGVHYSALCVQEERGYKQLFVISDNKQPQTKRRNKYGKTKLESESSDEGVNNQPQTKRGKKNHSNTPPSSGDTNYPLTKKNVGNTGKAVVISSDEESADEGKRLPELFLRVDDKKLIETGDWLMDRHTTAAQMLLKKDFPRVDGLQMTVGRDGRVEYSGQRRRSDTE